MTRLLVLVDGLGYHYLTPWMQSHCASVMRNDTPTWTLTNWTTLLTGMPRKEHGIRDYMWLGKRRTPVPWLTLLDDQKTALVTDWPPMRHFVHSGESVYIQGNVQDAIRAVKSGKYDLVVYNFDRLDDVGHRHGWGSPQYQRTLQTVEKRLRKLSKLCPMAVTADHGGEGLHHDDGRRSIIREVPLLLTGKWNRRGLPKRTKGVRKWLLRNKG